MDYDGGWFYEDLIWSVPNEDNYGYITDQKSNQVLGIYGENSLGSKVMLQTKDNPENRDQKWIRVATDEEGFFALKNLKSGLFLNNGQDEWDPALPTLESILYSNILNSELGIKQNISKVTRNIPIFQQMGNTFPEELKSQRYFVLNLEMTTGL